MTEDEFFVLEWLAKEDFSPLGSCDGPVLRRIVRKGLAEITPKGVALTESGWHAIRERRN